MGIQPFPDTAMRKLLALFALFLVPATASAQVGHDLNFLTVPSSSRSLGLAGAGSTVIDPTIAPLNPGGLGIVGLYGQSAIVRNTHKFNEKQFRIGQEYDNLFVVGGYRWGPVDSATGFRYSLAFGLQRQDADWGILSYVDELLQIHSYHVYERSDNFSLAGAIEQGFEAGVGITLKNYESVFSREFEANGLLRDIGIMVRLPLAELSRQAGILAREKPPVHFEIALAAGYVWANRGGDVKFSDAQQPNPPPRLSRLGLSGESTLEYRGAKVAGILISRDEERFAPGIERSATRTHSGVEYDLLGIVKLQDGTYRSPYDEEAPASGYAVHSLGLVRWLGVLTPKSKCAEWVSRIDAYYQVAEFDDIAYGIDADTGLKEFGLVVRLFGPRP